MKVFYVRCSTLEQNEARQLAMAQEHCADKVFVDKASGKDTARPELQKMLAFVRDGDIVVCESFSRIARNTRDLLSITDELNSKGVKFISLKESIDTSTPQGEFMLTIFAALAQMERESILQRQSEGIAIAKSNGIYKGRKPMEFDKPKFLRMCKEWRNKERTAVSIQRAFNITSTTFYRWVRLYIA
ncbi:MAG: recombinase family protein [Ruminococcaceae bacterium]|nr:recombinase family protein [Oscillospiraceae bacterium]